VSRVTIARGHRGSQACCLSAFKGLEVPPLLDHVRFTYRKEKVIRFLVTWGGVPPASPRGSIDCDGIWLVLPSNVETLTDEKVNYSRKRSCLFMHSFIGSWYRMYMRT